MMADFGKTLIILGVLAIIVGILLILFGKIPGVGKLPGDILIKREHFTFYFPLGTCLLISLILSFIFFLWNQK